VARDPSKLLLDKIRELGLDETDLKSLEALWPYLSEILREACSLEAPLRGVTPQALGAKAVFELLQHYRAENAG
jgi:hypothetical protein